MALTVSGSSNLSPRRRRSRPQWNQQHQRKQEQHEPRDRSPHSPPTSLQLPRALQPSIPNEAADLELSTPKTSPQAPKNHHSTPPDPTSMPPPSFLSKLGGKSDRLAFLIAVCLLSFVLLVPGAENAQVVLRRRLLHSSSSSSSSHQHDYDYDYGYDYDYDYDYERRNLRYLCFGGPTTYGRGLEEEKRTSEAYPYLLSSSASDAKKAANHQDFVHNVAHPSYEMAGPTMASLCTQSIVVGGGAEYALPPPSIEYDVVTLEYSPGSSPGASDAAAFLSSIRLLVRRLKQRYPLAKIVLIRLWSPSDLVYHDAATDSASDGDRAAVSFDDWRSRQPSKTGGKRNSIREANSAANARWTFREPSQIEREVEESLESIMDSEGVLIYNLPRPEDTNDYNLGRVLEDWFLEEREDDDPDDPSRSTSFRYTLSREGHSIVARNVRDIVASSKSSSTSPNSRNQRMQPPPTGTTSSLQRRQQKRELLFSWGSGDHCRFWYDAEELLPRPETEHGSGLRPGEIAPDRHALEVVGKRGTRAAATLRVRNPFDTERMIYLTYLTASATAASNKVYPKTRVRVVAAASANDNDNDNDNSNHSYNEAAPGVLPRPPPNAAHPTTVGSTPSVSMSHSLLPSSSSVILDPTHYHDDDQDHHRSHQQHRTRTSAVGVVPAFHDGILEFAPLEEYTVHPFRIVGVSILSEQDDGDADVGAYREHSTDEDGSRTMIAGSDRVSFEFAMVSPRKLSVVGGAGLSSDEDEGIDGDTNP